MTRRIGLCLALLATVLVGWASGAWAQSTASFKLSPTAGRPGTTIAVASVTPCPPVAGVTGPARADVSVSRGSTSLGKASFPIDAAGKWSGSLRISTSASPGAAQVTVFCIANPQAEGAYFDYAPRTFTVLAAGAQLAATGRHTGGLAALGASLVLAGALLELAGRRAQPRGMPRTS
ncbi:MAG TPA: hypothetical protein VFA94_12560 [Acidimicrobiales bacterium]|nr:hypothetical protein [Acidimicrobiales bacterium]